MTGNSLPQTVAPLGAGLFQAAVDWQAAAANVLWAAQRAQWRVVAAWQRELMDIWICRFGGGVPLDG